MKMFGRPVTELTNRLNMFELRIKDFNGSHNKFEQTIEIGLYAR